MYKTILYMCAFIMAISIARAVGYVRVSSAEQSNFSEGHVSLAVQEKNIRDWCVANGYNLVRIFSDVASARDISKQKSLTDLANYVRANNIQLVVVYNISRFSRNAFDGLNFIKNKLLTKGVNIQSVIDGCQYRGTAGKNLFTLSLAFGENQSNTISDNVKSSHTFLSELGFQFGVAPYGMKAIRVPSDVNPQVMIRKFVINEEENAIIHTILLSTLTVNATANNLNSQGITRRGKQWNVSHIRNIIAAHGLPRMRNVANALPQITQRTQRQRRRSSPY